MPAAARTRKTPTPAPAETVETVTVAFRGVEFAIDAHVYGSARLMLALASNEQHRVLFELLGPANLDRFLTVVKRGEQLSDVAGEFYVAVNEAEGWGDSK